VRSYGWALDALAAFAVTLVACALVARIVAVPEGPFAKHLERRMIRSGARTLIVLGVIGAGVGYLGGSPAGVLVGTLAGWLLPSAWEAKRIHDRIARADRRCGD